MAALYRATAFLPGKFFEPRRPFHGRWMLAKPDQLAMFPISAAARAAALNTTVEELAAPALDQLAREEVEVNGHPPAILREVPHDEWKRGSTTCSALARSRADRYPSEFEADVSRDAMYKEFGE